MTITSEEVALLDDDDVQNIQTHYDLAMESEHGTGNHLLLMSCLSGHGFYANGTDEAIEMAEEIIRPLRENSMELDKIITGDSAVVLQSFPPDCIDLTVTSPPYFNAKEYSQYETYQAYLGVLETIFTEIFRVTRPSRMVIVNLSPVIVGRRKRSEQSYRIPIPFHFVPLMEKIGFEFLEDIIWKKPEGSAVKRNGGFFQHRKPVAYKPNLVTEYILVFKKPAQFLIDKILKNEPVTDIEIEWTNVWSIQPETKSKHPAPFPEELARKCISYYSYKGDVVLDPFSGSGTTPKMAKLLNRHYIGIDTSAEYVALANERLAQVERGLTPPAPDGGDSAPSQALSTPDMFSAIEHEPTPAPRR